MLEGNTFSVIETINTTPTRNGFVCTSFMTTIYTTYNKFLQHVVGVLSNYVCYLWTFRVVFELQHYSSSLQKSVIHCQLLPVIKGSTTLATTLASYTSLSRDLLHLTLTLTLAVTLILKHNNDWRNDVIFRECIQYYSYRHQSVSRP